VIGIDRLFLWAKREVALRSERIIMRA
jgi:hypothetical protein